MAKKYMYTLVRNSLCLGILLLVPGLTLAQFDMDEFLSRSADAMEIQAIRQQQSYLEEANFRSPFLREVELRIRARDLQSGPNDYRFRVAPLNPFERKANREHTEILAGQIESEGLIAFSNVLNRRYKLLIELYYLQQLSALEEVESGRYRQLAGAYSRRQDAAEDLIELDRRLFQNELQGDDIQAETRKLIFLIRQDYEFDGEVRFDGFNMVRVGQVKNDLGTPAEGTNIFVMNEQKKADLARADWEINRQESFSNIGFIQAEYRAYRGETINETMGLQLGLQLPLVNPDRPDLARRKLDVMEDDQDVLETAREVDTRLFTWENELKTKISQYERITEKLATFESLRPAGYGNIGAMMELITYRNDLNRRQLELYADILRLYIDWLQFRGMLTAEPMINYLSGERTLLPAN